MEIPERSFKITPTFLKPFAIRGVTVAIRFCCLLSFGFVVIKSLVMTKAKAFAIVDLIRVEVPQGLDR